MLPIFTTGQVKNGVDSGDLLIDLSDYARKKDTATKVELESLTAIVANKLDAEPQHKHHIDDIKQLQTALDGKYDTSQKYSHNVILSDTEKIAYLESPKVQRLEVAKNSVSDGYNFYVDDSNGDLMIVSPASVLIATYSISSHSWSFGGVKLEDIPNSDSVNTLRNNVDSHTVILENHTEALNAVCNATLANITSIDILNTSNNAQSNLLETHSNELSKQSTDIAINTNDIATSKTKIASIESIVNSYIAKTDSVLKNHYDALLMLCEKHGMVDSNTTDTPNLTPA